MNTDDSTLSAPSRRQRRAAHGVSRRKQLTIALLLLMVLGSGWYAARNLRSALALKILESDLRSLERRPELTADPLQLQQLHDSAKAVRELAGSQVEAQELIARVHWLTASVAATPQLQIAELRMARDALHQALRQRSSWPYTWALLARIEFHLAPRGKAAVIALSSALDLGMRGYGLQRQLLELRLLAEGRIDAALMQRVRDSFIAGLREQGPPLAEQAMNMGRIEWACSDPQARALVEHWCIRIEGWIRSRRR